jgi:hypothetical protein
MPLPFKMQVILKLTKLTKNNAKYQNEVMMTYMDREQLKHYFGACPATLTVEVSSHVAA